MNFDAIVNPIDEGAFKLLSDNRDFYIQQSANTRNGVIPAINQYEIDETLDGRYATTESYT